MRVFKIFLLVLFSLGLTYSLYSTIGYLILGIKTPHLVGSTTTYFTGMFIMALTFLILSVILLVLIILLAKSLKKR